jgi:hypothetical protein
VRSDAWRVQRARESISDMSDEEVRASPRVLRPRVGDGKIRAEDSGNKRQCRTAMGNAKPTSEFRPVPARFPSITGEVVSDYVKNLRAQQKRQAEAARMRSEEARETALANGASEEEAAAAAEAAWADVDDEELSDTGSEYDSDQVADGSSEESYDESDVERDVCDLAGQKQKRGRRRKRQNHGAEPAGGWGGVGGGVGL